MIASVVVLASGCRSILGLEDPVVTAADGSVDGPPADARTCFGEPPFEICLGTLPTAPVAFSLAASLDTGDACPFVYGETSSEVGWCVIVGTSIMVSGQLSVTGSRPLVVLATDILQVGGTIDVASYRDVPDSDFKTKPGPASSGCPTHPLASHRSAGRPGGSFGTAGGAGGVGDDDLPEPALPALDAVPMTLRGGCPGGRTNPTNPLDTRTEGGGAVYLLGGTELRVGGTINASGAGGEAGSVRVGGAGGGSGGMIVLWSPQIVVTGEVFAHGGGGGAGGGTVAGSIGEPGSESTGTTNRALGGVAFADAGGGPGGDGAGPLLATGGAAGKGGDAMVSEAGGGGGGGGVGFILLRGDPTPGVGGVISPAPR